MDIVLDLFQACMRQQSLMGHFFWVSAYAETGFWIPVGRNCCGEKLVETVWTLLLGFSRFGLFAVLSCEMSGMPLDLICLLNKVRSPLIFCVASFK